MLRALVFFLKLAVVVAAAVWLAEQPGSVAVEWLGYRLETSVGILLLAVALVAGLAALVYRWWGLIKGAPWALAGAIGRGRRGRGYRALTQGMVAVAAGEPDEARRWARKADALLDEPPLTMLLSAQAAQLDGDDAAAKRYFTAMLERPETRFLGLRGLLRQAEREGDRQAALDYVRRAHAIRPDTAWVLTSLFELSLKTGDLDGALEAVREAGRYRLLSREAARRRRAVVLTEKARAARLTGELDAAEAAAAEAHRLAPDLAPAALAHAELLLDAGRRRKAAGVVERAWAAQPHPDLAEAYARARPADDAMGRLRQLAKLTKANPEHRESHLALGRAALEAGLWGEARRHLKAAGGEAPGEAVCRLLAEVAERESGDREAARAWLLRAAEAPGDPAWICRDCGAMTAEWHARCGACEGFDTLEWRTPQRVVPTLLAEPGPALTAESRAAAVDAEAEPAAEAARANGEAEPGEAAAEGAPRAPAPEAPAGARR